MRKSVCVPKPPLPFPSSTETVLEALFAVARSGLPSPFRSPIATDQGWLPVPKSACTPKVPSPFPISTETEFPEFGNGRVFATARSGLPSAFRSPIATE